MDKYDYPWRLTTQVGLFREGVKRRAEEKARIKMLNGE
jgi:hypothetical protein